MKFMHIEGLEEKGLTVKKEDIETVKEHIEQEIELTLDKKTNKIYNEAGQYIADVVKM